MQDIIGALTPYLLDPGVKGTLGYELAPKLFGKLFGSLTPSPALESHLLNIPSETTPYERRFLYNFFAHIWSGSGNVIEIGPFLGGTSRAIAKGMLDNPRRNPNSLFYTYDKFTGYYDGAGLADMLDPLFKSGELSLEIKEQLKNGQHNSRFLDIFNFIHQGKDYWPLMVPSDNVLPDLPEQVYSQTNTLFLTPDTKFDVAFVDGCKSWFSTKFFLMEMSKCSTSGAYFIFQDYGMFTCFWIPAILAMFRDYFELVAYVDYTYAFRLTKPLDARLIHERCPDFAEKLSPNFFNQLFMELGYEAGERNDVGSIVRQKLQHAGALAYLGEKEIAKQLIINLSQEPFALKYGEEIKKALKTPTYRPGETIYLS